MRLETDQGVVSDSATFAMIGNAIAGMTEVGKSYIILSSEDEVYFQAAGSIPEGNFIVERRDGCAAEHYQGNRRVTATELLAMMESYLRGNPCWSHVMTWSRIDVGDAAPSALAMTGLGSILGRG